jgi:hypothetical protein
MHLNRNPDLRIANGKRRVFMDHFFGLETRDFLPKTLKKGSREQEINY